MNEEGLRDQLKELPLAEVRWYALVESTNTVAMDWAAQGALDGSLVAADQQNAGRGRMKRKWVTNPGAALAFSLILRPKPQERDQVEMFSPLGALGVSAALSAHGLAPQIKWPNDVLLQQRKVCGILVEAAWTGQALDAVVLGIGVNVAASSVPPPEDLLFPASCVETALGKPVERAELLREILDAIFCWRARLGSPDFMEAWQSRLAYVGETVCVSQTEGEQYTGELLGVDAHGALRLRLQNGKIATILVGDVSLRPQVEWRGGYVR